MRSDRLRFTWMSLRGTPEVCPQRDQRIQTGTEGRYELRTSRPAPPAHSLGCHTALRVSRFASIRTGGYVLVYTWPEVPVHTHDKAT